MPAIVNCQQRIDRLRSTLSSDLDQLFATTLTALTDTKAESRLSDLERSKLMTDLTECLRTYDMLGLWRDAEDVFRREVVRAFVKKVRVGSSKCLSLLTINLPKTIHPGGLTAPHSPIVPNTPFHFTSPPTATSNTPHQIPYTPFTAFIPKQAMFRLSTSDIPHAHLLDDADDSLAKLYNQLLRFVERDAYAIMNAAEKVSGKESIKISSSTQSVDGVVASHTTRPDDHDGEREREGTPKFEIMANVVWDELGRTIMDEIGSIVFASGKPNEFRKVRHSARRNSDESGLMSSNSITRQHRVSFDLWNFLHRQWKRLTACGGIRHMLHSSDGGSYLFTFSCGGRRL